MSKTRTDLISILLSAAVAVAASLGCTAAVALGLQVSPILVELPVGSKATELWLVNTSDQAMQAQVRVYQWEQKEGVSVLIPTSDLIVSPPVVKIAAKGEQMVRVIRGKGASGATSPVLAFRLLVNELPHTGQKKKSGIDFVVEYSVPTFVYQQPADKLQPQVNLSMVRQGNKVKVAANNNGDLYGKLSQVHFVDKQGKRTTLADGLLGYVLPQREARWDIKQAPNVFAQGGTMELLLNGKTYTQAIPPLSR
ncbi:molecular chaperone [Serratia microhaemolytica]|uniref:fimbrial biogenesis chaperone n=1 Tax=Serratia microhaemolytica TaxID=2675110 RepID=UPI000FDF34F8|nr:fimbria/pilus periplasmic chaperone [Serratia microhaemolytica]